MSASRPWLALATAVALITTGCAGLVEAPQLVAVDLGRPEMQQFDVVRSRTSIERDAGIETRSDPRSREITPALYWSGIAIGTLGAVGTTGFAIAGRVSRDRLNGLYDDGTATHEELDRAIARGNLWNTLTITSAVLMVVGYTVAIVTYGVDWNRCGKLAPAKRRCREAGY